MGLFQSKPQTYKIVTSLFASTVEKQVSELMADGWIPCGGVNKFFGLWSQSLYLPTK